MNNRLMMVIAVVAGLIATALAFLYIQSATSAVEQSNREETTKLLAYVPDLPAGHPIDPDKDIVERTVGVESNAGIIRNALRAIDKDSLRGQRTNRPVLASSFVMYSDLAPIQTLTIGPGNRAMSIVVDASSTFGGMLIPNDRVDLVISYKIPPPDATRPLDGVDANNPQSAINAMLGRVMMQSALPSEWEAEVVLENVRVAAIGDQLSASRQQFSFAPNQTATARSNIVTIELTPDQALHLIRSQAGGGNPLTLLLRPSDRFGLESDASSASNAGGDGE